jgi:hypothetical protein
MIQFFRDQIFSEFQYHIQWMYRSHDNFVGFSIWQEKILKFKVHLVDTLGKSWVKIDFLITMKGLYYMSINIFMFIISF